MVMADLLLYAGDTGLLLDVGTKRQRIITRSNLAGVAPSRYIELPTNFLGIIAVIHGHKIITFVFTWNDIYVDPRSLGSAVLLQAA